jgi:hypothetical protein
MHASSALVFALVLLAVAAVAIGATVAAVRDMFRSPWEPRR